VLYLVIIVYKKGALQPRVTFRSTWWFHYWC